MQLKSKMRKIKVAKKGWTQATRTKKYSPTIPPDRQINLNEKISPEAVTLKIFIARYIFFANATCWAKVRR